jgi:predicted transcriptional regulator
MQYTLKFPRLPDLSIARLEASDTIRKTDVYRQFCQLVLENEPKYPAISRWLHERVHPGITHGERTAFVAYYNNLPIATAVFKKGDHAKICHLRIADRYQDQHLGELFFALMILEAKPFSSQLHFTLPEGLWERERGFFEAFGFSLLGRATKQYRTGEEELCCLASMEQAWHSTLEKLPKLLGMFSVEGKNADSDLVLSMKPRWAHEILSGQKTVEVRRKFSTKWIDRSISIYSSQPEMKIVGKAQIKEVVPGSPNSIWRMFSSNLGCSKGEFDSYVEGCSEVFAIVLENVCPYSNQISVRELSSMIGEGLTPPQSYRSTDVHSGWGRALSLAQMLQTRAFRNPR